MTDLEKALASTDDDAVSFYLGDVSVKEFRKDVSALCAKHADKEAIREAIKKLESLI